MAHVKSGDLRALQGWSYRFDSAVRVLFDLSYRRSRELIRYCRTAFDRYDSQHLVVEDIDRIAWFGWDY